MTLVGLNKRASAETDVAKTSAAVVTVLFLFDLQERVKNWMIEYGYSIQKQGPRNWLGDRVCICPPKFLKNMSKVT